MTSDAQAPTVPESLGQSWILATVPGLEGSTTIALLVLEDVQTLDTSTNTATNNLLVENEQACFGSVLQTSVFAITTQEVYSACKFTL